MKITRLVMDKILAFGEATGRQHHLFAISSGMMMTLPFMVVGAFFLIFANPPVTPEQIDPATANVFMRFMLSWKLFTVEHMGTILAPYNMTMGIIGLLSAFTIAYCLAQHYQMKPQISGLVAVSLFLMTAAPISEGKISLDYLGANGLFTAIVISLVSVEITRLTQKFHWEIPFDDSIPPAVAAFINSLVPLALNIFVVYGANWILIAQTGLGFPALINKMVAPAMGVGNSLWGYIAILLFGNILWLFGINGTSIIFPIVFFLGINNSGINGTLYNAGEAPNVLMNLQMFRYYALGGAGNTIGLALLMMFSRVSYIRTVGKMAIIPGICGINEPILFGLPVVLNPILAIPFICMPIVVSLIGYYAQAWGLVSLGYMVDPSFTPFFIQLFLSALDWRNVFLGFVMVGISVVVYLPFFKLYERSILDKTQDLE